MKTFAEFKADEDANGWDWRPYNTLAELVSAIRNQEIDPKDLRFTVDNDSSYCYLSDGEDDYDSVCIFGGCGAAYDPVPEQLAIDALALLGIHAERP